MNLSTPNSIPSMKNFSTLKALAFVFAALPLASFATEPKAVFEENKNQWPAVVKMKADIPGGVLFLEQNTFTYLLKESVNWHRDHRNESGGPVTQKMHCFKVHFENSNLNSEIFGNNRYSWHRNYYLGNDKSKWASNVPVYERAYYKDLYSNIDLQYYNVDNNLKYDIIVHPGGDAKNLKLYYEGTDGLSIQNGHLFVKTSIYDIIEQKPYAYQVINSEKHQVACSYVLKNDRITFDVGAYDHSLPLIIDPTLIASTYSGSTADNWGFTATYDAGANIYMGGIAAGTGYPTTVGAHDQTYNGGTYSAGSPPSWPFDISLTKFNPTGSSLMWSTYYGGIFNEQPHSLVVNSANELYVVGRTNSTNFPTVGPYQAALAGGYDMILGKFSSTGALLASTYLGGTSDDCINYNIDWNVYGATKFSYTDDGRSEIIIDANSNVYVAANTKSANFPVVGAYQAAFGGTQDAVVFKMNSSLSSLVWSTFLGGTGTDAAYGLKLDNSGNVYVTGGTTGANFPTTAGVLNQTYQGGLCDGFITVFNPSVAGPSQLLRSTFLGTAAYDQSYMIEIDASGDLYCFGQTQGAYLVTAGVYSNPNSGQFIHKITGNLQSTVFSTVVGTGGNAVNISPTAFLVDSCQTIYIAGWGRSSLLSGSMPAPSTTSGLPVTANAQQPTTDGRDHYFMVLEPDAKALFYATYYGEVGGADADHVDGGTCRFDKRGVIYQACCASCGGGQGFPTTPGAYSTTNNSNHINIGGPNAPPSSVVNCNEAVVKMDVSVNPVAKANVNGVPKGCAPFVISFTNTGSVADNYIWDFGDGGTSTSPAPTYTYYTPGNYMITLYAIDSIGICGYVDTSIVAVTVGQQPTLATAGSNIACSGGVGSATVTPTGGLAPLTYAWSPSGGNNTVASNLAQGCYTVLVTDATGCSATQSVCITQPTAITSSAASTGASCGLGTGSATVTVTGGTPGYTYSWAPSGGSTSAATGLGQGTYTVSITDANGCPKTQTVTVNVTNGPTVTATSTGSVSCNGQCTGSAQATLIGGTAPYTYLWSPTSAGTGQTATGLCAGPYSVVITDAMGCSATNSVTIQEPNALTISFNQTNVNCFGGNTGSATATVGGGTAPYTYSWSPSGGSGATANNLAAGSYTVTVTDKNGCTKPGNVTITQPSSAMSISTSVSGTSCGGATNGGASVAVAGGSGTPPYTYLWSNNATTPTITNISGRTYSVIVTDSKGCTATSTATMPTSVQPVADFTYAPIVSCEGVYVNFTDASTNAQSWNWNFGGAATSTQQNPGFSFPYNVTYNVTLIVSNPPCKDTVTKPVTILDMSQYFTMKEANVFTPNNDGLNDCFLPALAGAGADTLKECIELEVFDRWGVKMFESVGSDNCWNGKNRKDSKDALDGTYYYIAKLGETTIRGYVTLARHK